MPRVVVIGPDRNLRIVEREDPPLAADQVRVAVAFASPKQGTSLHMLSDQSVYAGRRFDLQQRLFVDDPAPSSQAGQPFGNTVVGRISAVGADVDPARIGQRVYAWAEIAESVTRHSAAVSPMPVALTDADAMCFDPAEFAFAAVRDARVGLGDRVAVFGMGAIGLCAVRLLRAAGCELVAAIDPVTERRRAAIAAGAHAAIDPAAEDVGAAMRRLCAPGADVAIEASGNYQALAGALRAVRQCGRIVSLGFYPGKATPIALGAEWLHNRLELIASMPVWGNPSREHPLWDYARLRQAVVGCFERRLLEGSSIIDRVVDFDALPEAFATLSRDPSWAIKLGVRVG